MNEKEDLIWRALLAQGSPAFAGESEAPFGLATRVLAEARARRGQQDVLDRIGLRAILASVAMVVFATALTLSLQMTGTRDDADPGVQSLALVEHVPVS